MVIRNCIAGTVVGLAAFVGCTPGGGQARSAILIENVTVVDVASGGLLEHAAILTRGDRIVFVGEGRLVDAPKDVKRIDGSDYYAIPGLWDSHVHLTKSGESVLPLLVASGVTQVRDMGSRFEQIQDMRQRIERGELLGPQMLTPGPMLEAPETIERIRVQRTGEPYLVTRIAITDSGQARRVVDSLARLGVDFIKIRESQSFSLYSAVTTAAAEVGIPVVGHPPFGSDFNEGLRLGLQTIEHGSYPYPFPEDSVGRQSVVGSYVESGAAVTPTLTNFRFYTLHPDSLRAMMSPGSASHDRRMDVVSPVLRSEWQVDLLDRQPLSERGMAGWNSFLDTHARDINSLRLGGVPLLAGSDLGALAVLPGWGLKDELDAFATELRMSPLEVLQVATAIPAEVFGMTDSLGSITPDKRADIVLLGSNPLESTKALRDVRAVIASGDLVDSIAIRRWLRGASPRDTTAVDLFVPASN